MVLSPPPEFKDDPDEEAGAIPFRSAMEDHCCSYFSTNDESWELTDPFRRKRDAEFPVSRRFFPSVVKIMSSASRTATINSG